MPTKISALLSFVAEMHSEDLRSILYVDIKLRDLRVSDGQISY